MVVYVEIGRVELSAFQDDQNQVFAVELAQIFSPLIVIQAVDIMVEPYFASAQGRTAVGFQADTLYLVFA